MGQNWTQALYQSYYCVGWLGGGGGQHVRHHLCLALQPGEVIGTRQQSGQVYHGLCKISKYMLGWLQAMNTTVSTTNSSSTLHPPPNICGNKVTPFQPTLVQETVEQCGRLQIVLSGQLECPPLQLLSEFLCCIIFPWLCRQVLGKSFWKSLKLIII